MDVDDDWWDWDGDVIEVFVFVYTDLVWVFRACRRSWVGFVCEGRKTLFEVNSLRIGMIIVNLFGEVCFVVDCCGSGLSKSMFTL